MKSLSTDGFPKRGNFLSAFPGRLILWLFGWKIQGALPDQPKFVLVVAPHTSNWDFLFAVAAMLSLRLAASWLGKSSLFFWPLGSLLRWLGGIPVDRSSPHGVVSQALTLFRSRNKMALGLSPEGTRKRVERWKTGFYQIALGAGVPIVLIGLDYQNKAIDIGPVFIPCGDLENDLQKLGSYYAGIKAKRPELFELPSSRKLN